MLRADIERLMEMTGVSATGAQMASAVSDAFLNGLRQNQPSVFPRVIEVVREVLNTEFEQAFNGGEIKDRQIALYAKYFTHEDVKGMLAFYQTDLGKKAITAMPSLTREGAALVSVSMMLCMPPELWAPAGTFGLPGPLAGELQPTRPMKATEECASRQRRNHVVDVGWTRDENSTSLNCASSSSASLAASMKPRTKGTAVQKKTQDQMPFRWWPR